MEKPGRKGNTYIFFTRKLFVLLTASNFKLYAQWDITCRDYFHAVMLPCQLNKHPATHQIPKKIADTSAHHSHDNSQLLFLSWAKSILPSTQNIKTPFNIFIQTPLTISK